MILDKGFNVPPTNICTTQRSKFVVRLGPAQQEIGHRVPAEGTVEAKAAILSALGCFCFVLAAKCELEARLERVAARLDAHIVGQLVRVGIIDKRLPST